MAPETIDGHRMPGLTVDTVVHHTGRILLVRRKEPVEGAVWALPGGYVDEGERVERAALREAKEETGLEVTLRGLVGVFSDPKRDPRQHNVSVAFYGVPKDPSRAEGVRGASDVKEARWYDLGKLPRLAFDHAHIIGHALDIIESRVTSRYRDIRSCDDEGCPYAGAAGHRSLLG
ncbi:MAG: NUDIX hydrolase [Euryarchaeota archaeon]|nr:NUDIX hydrolase [Euryarchaeota archaeon]